jgi:tetratricopeptide (TPR) repeat protein
MERPIGKNAIAFWTVLLAVFAGLGLTITGHQTAANACFLILGLIFAIAIFDALRNLLALALTKRLIQAGEYGRALALVRRIGLGIPGEFLLEMEGGYLSLAGQKSEAEQCFRRVLAGNKGQSRSRALILVKLAYALDDLGRHEEARHYFQTVVQMGDKTGSAGIGLAGLLLDHDHEPQKALDLILRVEAATQPRWTIKARALAQLGRRAEAEDAIARALQAADPKFRADLAGTHYEVGRAFLELQRTESAIEHFRIARDADPQGYCGSIAREKLEALAAHV